MSTDEIDLANPIGLQPNSLQDAIDRAGDAVKLLWKPNTPAQKVPVVPPEFNGWKEEQMAWHENVALLDLSHHMMDMLIEGTDAVRLLSYASANNYDNFAVGQAKQFITVDDKGNLVQDAILFRLGENKFNLAGIGTAQNWVAYHAQAGSYDVELTFDPSSEFRPGPPTLFRYQVQGPKAAALLHDVFGDTLDGIKFFHFQETDLDGRHFSGLRHGMAGQPGVELFGPWEHAQYVKDRLLKAGEAYGLAQVGGLAYYTIGVYSGWLATPVAAVYSPALSGFREHTSAFSYEGMFSLQGSYYSPSIEDYYRSPYELGYGRSIAFNHDFFGRDALEATKDTIHRAKVTLVWNPKDVARIFGADSFVLSYTKDRVEIGSELVGVSEYTASLSMYDTVHSLAIIEDKYAEPGTEVEVVWGQNPGPTEAAGGASDSFERIRATVAPAPYHEYARTGYRGA
jgi:vanillate/3-O-methylgallate O-demethylase